MSIQKISDLGEATKIEFLNNEILYVWHTGRFLVKADNDNVESVNTQLSEEDPFHIQNFKYSEQTEVYGTIDATTFVEYLILNQIFFSPDIVYTKTVSEAIKMTEIGKITYFGKAPIGTLQSEAAWQCSKFDETVKTNQALTWADGGKYTQVATDLTSLTYL